MSDRAPSWRRSCAPADRMGSSATSIFWDRPISLRRRVYYNVASRSAPMTGTIQPPLLAWAWRIAVGDPAAEPRIARHHEWLAANRDLDGDGLLWLVQPDESGLDSSPKFDPVWGRRAHARLGFPLLVARNRRLDWDARRVRDARRARPLRGRPPTCCGGSPGWRWASRRSPRRSSIGCGTSGWACSSTRRSRAACAPRSRPGPRWPPSPCPTCRKDRAPHGRGAPAGSEALLAAGATALGVRRGAELRAGTGRRAGSAATGAAQPGSTPPGCCGSACVRLGYRAEADGDGAPLGEAVLARAFASTTTRTPARASAPRLRRTSLILEMWTRRTTRRRAT